VEAGRAGRFGCVIGVDRRGHAMALRDAGADVVVTDLAQVQVAVDPLPRGHWRMRASTRRKRVSAKPCAPLEMAILRHAVPLLGRWR